jgi:hypothetical protein
VAKPAFGAWSRERQRGNWEKERWRCGWGRREEAEWMGEEHRRRQQDIRGGGGGSGEAGGSDWMRGDRGVLGFG